MPYKLILIAASVFSAFLQASPARADQPQDYQCEVKGFVIKLSEDGTEAIVRADTWAAEQRREAEEKGFGGFVPCMHSELLNRFPLSASFGTPGMYVVKLCAPGSVRNSDSFKGLLRVGPSPCVARISKLSPKK